MSKVKLFSFDRFAKFGVTFVNPSDIYAVRGWSFKDKGEIMSGYEVVYGEGHVISTGMKISEIEAEINRALEATHKAHMDVAEEAKEKVQKLMEELNKPSTKVDPFSMNDFYPDLDKDKKGYN